MSRIVLVGEDGLSCALGQRLLHHALPRWTLAMAPIDKRGITKLVADLPRYLQAAQHGPSVLCIADTDGQCPVQQLRQWLPHGAHRGLLFRLAHSEAESWLLADPQGLHAYFGIRQGKVPAAPDDRPDPKGDLLGLIDRYGKSGVKKEMIQRRGNALRQATGYNTHLATFTATAWGPDRAASRSPSLQRAIRRIRELDRPTDAH